MNNTVFAGTGALTRFILRRDRLRLPLWILGAAAFMTALVPLFDGLFTTELERLVMAQTMGNPAMVALVGPVYGLDNYHTGALYANMMLALMCIVAALMNIFLVTRHSRQDEEQGRLEVIRALPVGRLSSLAAGMWTALGANVLLALVTGLGVAAFGVEGISPAGGLLLGTALGVTGLFFAAATAVACQLTANSRTAAGLSLGLLLVLYMLRAMGDTGAEALSLISPLGLILRCRVFVENRWWPVAVVLLLSALLTALAFLLARARDLGRGLIPEKRGRRHASRLLSGPLGLALRLLRTSIVVWSVAILLFAAMYGSIFGDMDSFLTGNSFFSGVFTQSGFSPAEQFIALLMVIMSQIALIPVLTFFLRVRGEEGSGCTEHLLGRCVSRPGLLGAYLGVALVMSVVFQLLTALGFWGVGSAVLATAPDLGTFIRAALAYLPAIWAVLGLAVALTGWLPERTGLVYAYLGLGFVMTYMGALAGLPEWTSRLTPFGIVPQLPVEELAAAPLAGLADVAAALIGLGFAGYRRRDLVIG